jgi:hypothetical protein
MWRGLEERIVLCTRLRVRYCPSTGLLSSQMVEAVLELKEDRFFEFAEDKNLEKT